MLSNLILKVDLVTDTSAYANVDVIDGVKTVAHAFIDDGGQALLQSLVVTDKAKQKSDLDIFFFDEAPATSVGADQAAFALADTDLAKCLGSVTVAAADYKDSSAASVATLKNIQLMLQAKRGAKARSLYLVVVSRGTPTYTSASDLSLKLGLTREG
jgi:hypothetical protein